jgi:hypothetical protein
MRPTRRGVIGLIAVAILAPTTVTLTGCAGANTTVRVLVAARAIQGDTIASLRQRAFQVVTFKGETNTGAKVGWITWQEITGDIVILNEDHTILKWHDNIFSSNAADYVEAGAVVLPLPHNNIGFVSEKGGTNTIPSGATFVTFNHGLSGMATALAAKNITVVPGSFLARDTAAGNPGAGYVRISLVAPEEECVQAAARIRDFIISRGN